jgi:hypothetical protein
MSEPETIDAADYAEIAKRKRNKYAAQPVEADGYTFASKAEHRRYEQLKLMLLAGEIQDLVLHPKFSLIVYGVKVGRYTADFMYFDMRLARRVVEDVKGGNATRTEAYGLRKKLMKACHGIDVIEVAA